MSNLKMNFDLLQTLNLPEDVIFNHILPRLPVKSLIRFKSVCKNWFNFISTSEFAEHHLQFSSSSPHFLISKFCSNNFGNNWSEFHLLSYDEPNKILKDIVQLNISLFNLRQCPKIVGSSNGFVCLYCSANTHYGVDYFVLWNPSICKHRKISAPSSKRLSKCGFGYASSLNDYKIFAAYFAFDDCSPDRKSTQIWVFSLRVGKWEVIDFSSCGGDFDLIKSEGIVNGVSAGDCLYWYVFKSGGSFEQRIVCFNLVDEQIREISVTVSASEYIDFDCFEMKGCLSLKCRARDRDQSYGVWILKQKDGCDCWEKLFSMPSTVGAYGNEVLAFSSGGLCLVKRLKQLKLVDPTLEVDLENSQGIDFDVGVCSGSSHVESLISPISPFKTVQLYWHAWI